MWHEDCEAGELVVIADVVVDVRSVGVFYRLWR